MATINHKKYDEATETFKDFNVYDGKETLIFKVDGEAGNVGIGTASPSESLHIYRNGSSAEVRLQNNTISSYIRSGTDNLNFYVSNGEKVRITSAGNVGIGTSSPQSILHISAAKTTYTDYGVVFRGGTDNNNSHTGISLVSAGDALGGIIGSNYLHDGSTASQSNSNRSSAYIRFANTTSAGQTSSIEIGGFVKGSTSDVTRLSISNTGNVGIGTNSPSHKLDTRLTTNTDASQDIARFAANNLSGQVKTLDIIYQGSDNKINLRTNAVGTDPVIAVNVGASEVARFTTNGLTFNGDTAAANALDDYEEGTWTPSLGGTAAYAIQLGTYTKIGRQVVAKFALSVTTLGTGSASVISGLPFTSLVANRGGGGITYVVNPSTAYTSINPFVNVGVTTIEFVTSTTLGVWADSSSVFTNNSFISGTVTYFV